MRCNGVTCTSPMKSNSARRSVSSRAGAGRRNVVEAVAGAFLVKSPVVPALFQRQVPDQAANASELRHQNCLFFRGAQCVGVSAVSHIPVYGGSNC